MKDRTVYLITNKVSGNRQAVNATSLAAARAHMTALTWTIRRATSAEILDAASNGVVIEASEGAPEKLYITRIEGDEGANFMVAQGPA